MAVGIILILIVIASVLFHVFSPWQQTALASNWGTIDDTLLITVIICGFFFVVIILFMAIAVMRFRHVEGRRAHFEPENKKLEAWLIGLTSVGIAGMLAPGLVVYDDFVHPPQNAMLVEAVGQQWRWMYRFPGKDGKLGTSDVSHVNFKNPLGIDPDDPFGQDDYIIKSNAVHLPKDQAVKFLLRSKDVLHDFYVPQFRAKMDLVPGTVTYFWATPTKVGNFEILCAEYCGVGHYNMRGMVHVDEPEDFERWLRQQPTFADTLSGGTLSGLAQQGQELAASQGCLSCHSLDGSKQLAPSWYGLFGSQRSLEDGSTVRADEAYLRESITTPGAQLAKGFPPVMVSYKFSAEQLDALIAYIKTLVAADNSGHQLATMGERIAGARGCLSCHSLDGSPSVGPSWRGIYGAAEAMSDDTTITVDDQYLIESIHAPNAKIVKGYPGIMPADELGDEEVSAIIALIKSLSE